MHMASNRRLWSWQWMLVIGFVLVIGRPQVAYAAPFVDGVVFRDFNYNGIQDLGVISEPGIAGVRVDVYVAGVIAPVTTTTSGAGGAYAIDLSTASVPVNVGDPLRVEFAIPAPLNNYLIPGRADAGSGGGQSTSVRFINAYDPATSGAVNFALVNPMDYCHTTNPPIVGSCFVADDPAGPNGAMTSVVEFDYESGSTSTTALGADTQAIYTPVATASETGAVFGTAYNRRTNDVYIAAFARRHSGYRPGGTPGDVLVYDRDSGSVTLLVALPAGPDNHDTADYESDNTFWNDVGTAGIGDIDLDYDREILYMVNLFDKRIYALDLATNGLTSFAMPQPPDCDPAFTRPGGLKYRDRSLFVGVTCTGPNGYDPNNPAAPNDLRAYVYRDGVQVVSIPLDYDRGETSRGTGVDPNEANWYAWAATETLVPLDFGAFHYPQPWLLDVEIDANNFMILGIADRFGYQSGNDDNGAGSFEGVPAGDMLRLAPNDLIAPTGWILESGGSDGLNTTNGATNGQGPGGGEFYYTERYELNGNIAPAGGVHEEITIGGLANMIGRGEIVASAIDPTPASSPANPTFRSGGYIYTSHTTGQRTRSVSLYQIDAPGTFGKAAGVGDVEVACGPAPLEIGNYIWMDSDSDGVQSPGEAPISGVIVSLYLDHDGNPVTPMQLVTTTTTDASGHYYFNPGNVPLEIDFDGSGTAGDAANERMFVDINGDGVRGPNEPTGLLPFATYEVRIDDPANFSAPGDPLFEHYATAVVGSGTEVSPGANYRRNSNAQVTSDVDFVGLANLPSSGQFVTGDYGANDHTFDFGFNIVSFVPPTATPIPTSTTVPTNTATADPAIEQAATLEARAVAIATEMAIAAQGTLPPGLADVTTLPETGESPYWRFVLIIVTLSGFLILMATLVFIVRRKTPGV